MDHKSPMTISMSKPEPIKLKLSLAYQWHHPGLPWRNFLVSRFPFSFLRVKLTRTVVFQVKIAGATCNSLDYFLNFVISDKSVIYLFIAFWHQLSPLKDAHFLLSTSKRKSDKLTALSDIIFRQQIYKSHFADVYLMRAQGDFKTIINLQ